ncbi:MAG: hypothetical protein D6696_03120 [Acidobacteria bacterium]|nr:MAG: hypothetical protein D6696_03120 [Acidobacteriota bacterium]
MANPFGEIEKALAVLGQEAEVIPAVGPARLDLAAPDAEETYDRMTSGEAATKGIWETEPGKGLYRPLRPIHRRQGSALRHFVAGTARVYYLGTVLERERSSPIQFAQIGAAAIRRRDDGTVRPASAGMRVENLLILNGILSPQLLERFQHALPAGTRLITTSARSGGSAEPRSRGAHAANEAMRALQQSILEQLQEDPPPVLDGSLGNEYFNWTSGSLLAVLKSFRQESRFTIGRGIRPRDQPTLFRLLNDLPPESRTVVFPRITAEHPDGSVVFWYVRLHALSPAMRTSPLMGVIKVEMPNAGAQCVPTELVDRLSARLLAERTVAPYGSGARWHAHLYPLYLAGRLVRNRFHSEEVIRSGLRWPATAPAASKDGAQR